MRFLYGDSTPFPLETNFIETLKAAVQAAASLLRADQGLQVGQTRVEGAQSNAVKDAWRLDEMARTVLSSLEPHLTDAEAPQLGVVASQLVKAAHPVFEAAKAEITLRRDATLREVETQMVEHRDTIPKALEAFFAGHELPGMSSRFLWKGGPGDEPGALVTRVSTAFGLEALLTVELPPASLFHRAFKLGELDKGARLRLQTASGWIRKGTELKSAPIDLFTLTEAAISPESASFVLRRPGKPPQPGVEVVLRAEGQLGPIMRSVGPGGEPADDPIALDGVETTMAKKVLSRVEEELRALARSGGRHLEKATFEGASVRDLERTTALARRFIDAVAPLTHEMRRRASSASELALKCELASGRREELYVDRKQLIACFHDLDDERRAFFDVLGFEHDVVEGEVTSRVSIGSLPLPAETDDEDTSRLSN
jgi:hypothetical protein